MSIKADIDRGIEIRQEMKALKLELDALELRLIAAARAGEHVPLSETSREGRRFLARGTEKVVPVIFTADKLISSFAENSAMHQKISAISPGFYQQFFRRKVLFERSIEEGNRFRKTVAEMLGADAPAFITACVSRDKDGITKSDEKIHWDRAEEVA